jgi:hypothetical protein
MLSDQGISKRVPGRLPTGSPDMKTALETDETVHLLQHTSEVGRDLGEDLAVINRRADEGDLIQLHRMPR